MRLTPELLLQAYAVGVFPMAESRKADSLHWVAPERRGLLSLNQFHAPRRLLRTFRSGKFFCTLNHAPHEVIHSCATAHGETWINQEIEELYCGLATRKTVHSIEVWQNPEADTGTTTEGSTQSPTQQSSTETVRKDTKESSTQEKNKNAKNSPKEVTHNEITPKRNIRKEKSMKETIKAANENTPKEITHNKNSPRENSHREESMKDMIKDAKNSPALVGGLYGLALGGIFFGESMFSLARDASKVALVELVLRLRHGGFVLLDTQFLTPHLAQFGIEEITREAYQEQLAKALTLSAALSPSFTEQDRAQFLSTLSPHD